MSEYSTTGSASSARLRQVQEELAEVREAAARLKGRETHVRGELGAAQKALAASQQDLTAARAELDSARVQIDSDRELIDQLIADRAGLRAEVAKLWIQLARDTDASVSHTQVPECTTDHTEEASNG